MPCGTKISEQNKINRHACAAPWPKPEKKQEAWWAASSDALRHRSEWFIQQSISVLSVLPSSTEGPLFLCPLPAHGYGRAFSSVCLHLLWFSSFSEAIRGSWQLVLLLCWWASLASSVHPWNVDFAAVLHRNRQQRWHLRGEPQSFNLITLPHSVGIIQMAAYY